VTDFLYETSVSPRLCGSFFFNHTTNAKARSRKAYSFMPNALRFSGFAIQWGDSMGRFKKL